MAPFGESRQPTFETKVIGGRLVEVPITTPPRSNFPAPPRAMDPFSPLPAVASLPPSGSPAAAALRAAMQPQREACVLVCVLMAVCLPACAAATAIVVAVSKQPALPV